MAGASSRFTMLKRILLPSWLDIQQSLRHVFSASQNEVLCRRGRGFLLH